MVQEAVNNTSVYSTIDYEQYIKLVDYAIEEGYITPQVEDFFSFPALKRLCEIFDINRNDKIGPLEFTTALGLLGEGAFIEEGKTRPTAGVSTFCATDVFNRIDFDNSGDLSCSEIDKAILAKCTACGPTAQFPECFEGLECREGVCTDPDL